MFELYTGFHLAGPPLLRRPAVVLPDPDRPMDCASASDLEARRIVPCSYAPLPESAGHADGVVSGPSSSASVLRLLLFSFLLLVTVGVSPPSSILRSTPSPLDHQLEWTRSTGVNSPLAVGRGVREGVSSKSSGAPVSSDAASDSRTSWSNEAFQWQRTGFHFQPERNWMNDPNAPMFYKGWYHLFYQYNPYSSVWGNMSWGHAVSRDLIHWLHLPLAMVRDHWYDAQGVFTGSATMLPDGTPVILYTGVTDQMYEVQNLAYPADPSDPLLLHWTKSPSNPILKAPAGVAPENFRDPMTAWYDPADGSWRVAIGAVDEHHEGFTLVFRTKDFLSYELLPGVLHSVPGTGMWECVDFFPVLANGSVEGLDLDGSAANGFGLKHVIKASLWDYMDDYYAIGTYDSMTGKWTPDDPAADVGTGLRYDYGKFYASKTFYDSEKRRRVLWGWGPETDSEAADLAKGWASLQGVPRTVRLDEKTGGANLVQWPVEEVESLRSTRWRFADVEVGPGQVVPLELHGDASQLDINVEFEIKKDALAATTLDADVGFNCSTSGGAADRGAVGPFGLLVLADEGLTEQTAIYFYILRGGDGQPRTFVCQDNLRSSLAKDLVKAVYGSTVPVLDGENLSLRILVDHSIVETFAQGGRTCITSRAYPTAAIGAAARVFLFNNGTAASVTAASVEIWQLESAFIKPYPLPLNASSGRANRSSPL